MRRAVLVALGAVLVAFAVFVAFIRGQTPSQDPVKLSPQYYKVRLENDRVRVLEYHLKPGEKEVMHSHPAYVVSFLGDARVRTTLPDGTQAEAAITKDETIWRDAISHTTENIGRTDVRALVIELKR